jgi:LuxR family maltose regulon positive regulatory protein
MTIDELARRGRTTTRHVRALQTGGLLPHPRLVGRTGFYDDDHVERLRAVLRLQGQGFSLAAIGALVDAWQRGDSLGDVLGLAAKDAAGEDEDLFGWAGYEPWPRRHRAGAVSVVPTTVLAHIS